MYTCTWASYKHTLYIDSVYKHTLSTHSSIHSLIYSFTEFSNVAIRIVILSAEFGNQLALTIFSSSEFSYSMYPKTIFIQVLHSLLSVFGHLLCVSNYTVYQGCGMILCFKYNYSNDYVFTIMVNALRKVRAMNMCKREDGLI